MKKNKNVTGKVILIFILVIIFYIWFGVYRENKIRLVEKGKTNNIEIKKLEISENISLDEQKEKINIPKTYLGFDTCAKLEIPKINLETYVLSDYTDDGLKVCASKFWGPKPNTIGNFCIAGHNYEKENMFNHLIDLQIGDELYLSDNENGKCLYKIFDIYKVKPQNTEPISQETEGKRMVTLITCVNYSKNRLIVQAMFISSLGTGQNDNSLGTGQNDNVHRVIGDGAK